MLNTYSDEQLISLSLKGENAALETLIARYLKLVYYFVFKYVQNRTDAEDITQEVFVKVWRNLRKFDQTKAFRPWLYQIAKNTSLDFFKKKNTVPFSNIDAVLGSEWLAQNIADTSPLPEALTDQALLTEKFTAIIKKLSPKYAATILLRHGQNLNFREMADKGQEPINTVKSRYRRAILSLKKLMQE